MRVLVGGRVVVLNTRAKFCVLCHFGAKTVVRVLFERPPTHPAL